MLSSGDGERLSMEISKNLDLSKNSQVLPRRISEPYLDHSNEYGKARVEKFPSVDVLPSFCS